MAKKREKLENQVEIDVIRQHLLDMEPELRMAEGLVAILHALSSTADQVEPIALAPLAYLGADAVEKLLSTWRMALAAASSVGSKP